MKILSLIKLHLKDVKEDNVTITCSLITKEGVSYILKLTQNDRKFISVRLFGASYQTKNRLIKIFLQILDIIFIFYTSVDYIYQYNSSNVKYFLVQQTYF